LKSDFRQIIVAACISASLACTGIGLTQLNPDGKGSMPSFLLRAPLILVGQVLSVEQLGWRNFFTEHGTIVLFRVRVGVENVLKGDFGAPAIDVYTFLETGSIGGTNPMGFAVNYPYIFYLRQQAGRWRTVCDVYNQCAGQVLSGGRSAFKRDPKRPLSDDILRLLLTRGDHVSDGSMVGALESSDTTAMHPFSYARIWIEERKNTYLQILRQTSETATPPLRAEACVLLRELDQPCDLCANEKAEGKQGPK